MNTRIIVPILIIENILAAERLPSEPYDLIKAYENKLVDLKNASSSIYYEDSSAVLIAENFGYHALLLDLQYYKKDSIFYDNEFSVLDFNPNLNFFDKMSEILDVRSEGLDIGCYTGAYAKYEIDFYQILYKILNQYNFSANFAPKGTTKF